MKNCNPSDQELNAWLDGRLGPDQAKRLEQALRQNPSMRRHVEELREVRKLVQLAFAAETTGRKKPIMPEWRFRVACAFAAVLLLAVGASLGWFMHPTTPSGLEPELAARGALVLYSAPSKKAAANHNVLLHINGNDQQELLSALEKTEELLQHYQQLNRMVQVEVVANAGGINMLRADENILVSKRVRELQERYRNLTFLACRNTVEQLWAKQKGQVKLLPGVVVGPSAFDHVIQRLNEGWAYIKV